MHSELLPVSIEGYVAPGFEAVAEAFAENFRVSDEIGASVAVTVEDEIVVDLWGGYSDLHKTRLWHKDDLTTVYSSGKGVTALVVHMLVDRGVLDLDKPVAYYWPEFAAEGKENILLRWVLSHRSGVIGPYKPLAISELDDWDHVVDVIARTPPWWEPNTAYGYHAITFGLILGEVLRRVTGENLRDLFQRMISEPLGVDFLFKIEGAEHDKCIDVITDFITEDEKLGILMRQKPLVRYQGLADNNGLGGAGIALGYLPFGLMSCEHLRSLVVPGINAQTNARSLATIFGKLATGQLLSPHRISQARTAQSTREEHDRVLGPIGINPVWGEGFLVNVKGSLGPVRSSFGNDGAGGSLVFADTENRLSYSFVMNSMQSSTTGGGKRNARIIDALYSSLPQRTAFVEN